jgi:hypothetical protein
MSFQPFTPAQMLLSALLIALGGCADGGANYPSLATRPAERIIASAPPGTSTTADSQPPAPLAGSADLSSRLDELVVQARAGHQEFADKRPATERLVSAAGSADIGSDSWSVATQALSTLESARARTAAPMAEIDHIDVDDRLAHASQDSISAAQLPRPDLAAIAAARDKVAGWLTEEDAAIANFHEKLAH